MQDPRPGVPLIHVLGVEVRERSVLVVAGVCAASIGWAVPAGASEPVAYCSDTVADAGIKGGVAVDVNRNGVSVSTTPASEDGSCSSVSVDQGLGCVTIGEPIRLGDVYIDEYPKAIGTCGE